MTLRSDSHSLVPEWIKLEDDAATIDVKEWEAIAIRDRALPRHAKSDSREEARLWPKHG